MSKQKKENIRSCTILQAVEACHVGRHLGTAQHVVADD